MCWRAGGVLAGWRLFGKNEFVVTRDAKSVNLTAEDDLNFSLALKECCAVDPRGVAGL
ncbi:MAG: hypothetical protein AAF004_12735 [Pseudomonadota bacterium]